MTEPLNHKLDVSKIKTLTDVKNVFECMSLITNASEGYEKYELIKDIKSISLVKRLPGLLRILSMLARMEVFQQN